MAFERRYIQYCDALAILGSSAGLFLRVFRYMLSELEAGLRGSVDLLVGRALRPAAPCVFRRLRFAMARRSERGRNCQVGWGEDGIIWIRIK